MKSSVPPAFATWLLEHICFSNADDALVGDLLEEFGRRRSAAWYWRQVLAAILVGFGKAVRVHWALGIAAVTVGFAASNVIALVLRFVIVTAPGGVIHVSASPRYAQWFLASFVSGVFGGCLVAWQASFRYRRPSAKISASGFLVAWPSMARYVIPLQPISQPGALCTDYVFILAGIVAGVIVIRAPKAGDHSGESRFTAC